MADDLKARLAAAKAQAADARAARTPSDEEALAKAVELAEQEAANETAITAAVREHGPLDTHVAVVPVPDGSGRVIVLKRPDPAAISAFSDSDKAPKLQDAEAITVPCVCYPTKREYNAIIAAQPLVLASCAVRVLALAGARRTELTEK